MPIETRNINLCIFGNKPPVYSETFIRAHSQYLPFNNIFLYGATWINPNQGKNIQLSKKELSNRLLEKAARMNSFFWYELLPKYNIEGQIKKHKTHLVLAEYGRSALYIMPICKKLNIPLIVHFHGFDAYDNRVLDNEGKKYPQLFGQAAAIIAVSHDMKCQLLSLGVDPHKLYLNPCGVDLNLFKQTNPSKNEKIFVAIGRFVDKKAPQLSILAFKKALEDCPEARLIMIGDGYLWDSCNQLVQALGIKDRVDLLGKISHQEVAEYMQKARGFIQHSLVTSYRDSEGTPVAILEAGATGLPVIATRHAGIKDVVIENQTGYLVDEKDISRMAEYIVTIAKNPEKASYLGQNARNRISQHFSMNKSIKGLTEIILKTLP